MRSFATLLATLSLPLYALAAHHGNYGRHHGGVAPRARGDLLPKRNFPNARWTYYDITVGQVACGGKRYGANDFVVALNGAQFGDVPGSSQYCGKSITMEYNGKTVSAVIVDKCPGCPYGGIDCTEGVFRALAGSLDAGVITGTWDFNGGGGGGGSAPKEEPTTTSTPKYTPPETTSTPHHDPTTTTSHDDPPTTTSYYDDPTTTTHYDPPTTTTHSDPPTTTTHSDPPTTYDPPSSTTESDSPTTYDPPSSTTHSDSPTSSEHHSTSSSTPHTTSTSSPPPSSSSTSSSTEQETSSSISTSSTTSAPYTSYSYSPSTPATTTTSSVQPTSSDLADPVGSIDDNGATNAIQSIYEVVIGLGYIIESA